MSKKIKQDTKSKEKCPRCGCTESFADNCGWLAQPINWCARCGYAMGSLDILKDAMNKSQLAKNAGFKTFDNDFKDES